MWKPLAALQLRIIENKFFFNYSVSKICQDGEK